MENLVSLLALCQDLNIDPYKQGKLPENDNFLLDKRLDLTSVLFGYKNSEEIKKIEDIVSNLFSQLDDFDDKGASHSKYVNRQKRIIVEDVACLYEKLIIFLLYEQIFSEKGFLVHKGISYSINMDKSDFCLSFELEKKKIREKYKSLKHSRESL